ncbi:hypothetical protein I3760_02G017900 [Carya illinoinensis]|nr:hypothetical protein I3760_02G017900 [Carya illinoinensis]
MKYSVKLKLGEDRRVWKHISDYAFTTKPAWNINIRQYHQEFVCAKYIWNSTRNLFRPISLNCIHPTEFQTFDIVMRKASLLIILSETTSTMVHNFPLPTPLSTSV